MDHGIWWRTSDGVERWLPRGTYPAESAVDISACVHDPDGAALVAESFPLAPETVAAREALDTEVSAAFDRWVSYIEAGGRDAVTGAELKRRYAAAVTVATAHRAASSGYVLRPPHQGPTRTFTQGEG